MPYGRLLVHLCNQIGTREMGFGLTSAAFAVPDLLLFPVVQGVFRMVFPVFPPVIGMPLAPPVLGETLVLLINLVCFQLFCLPPTLTYLLTRGTGTVLLSRNVGPWREKTTTSRTPSFPHDQPPETEFVPKDFPGIRMAWCGKRRGGSKTGANDRNQNGWFSFVSISGSIPVSVEVIGTQQCQRYTKSA